MATAARIRVESLYPEAEESRVSDRRSLELRGLVNVGGEAAEAIIHNLSPTGMLIETTAELASRGEIEIDIPEAGIVRAAIVWHNDGFFGCQFDRPLSRPAISAALLRSPPVKPVVEIARPDEVAGEIVSEVADISYPSPLSLRAKAAIIGGFAMVCWLPVIAAIKMLA